MDSNLGLLISISNDFNPVFEENLEQIQRVEELSDGYHFKFGDHHTMVMYLIEVTHQ